MDLTNLFLAALVLALAMLVLGTYLGLLWWDDEPTGHHRAPTNPYSATDAGWCPA